MIIRHFDVTTHPSLNMGWGANSSPKNFTMYKIQEILYAMAPKILATVGGMQLDGWHAHTRACESPKHYKSTQDALLSKFDYFPYNQILHCLKYQWLSFNKILWTSEPNLDQDDLGGPSGTNIFF